MSTNSIEVVSAVDLSKYTENSVIVAKVSEETLLDNQSDLQKLLDIFRRDAKLSPSVGIIVSTGGLEISAYSEKELNKLGWFKKEDESQADGPL